jgi:hypothetical protein
MPRVKICDGPLMVELTSKRSTIGELAGRAAEILDCRRDTGNWLPDMTQLAVAAPESEGVTTRRDPADPSRPDL